MIGGYSGKILRVNLQNKLITVDEMEKDFYRKYLGGTGFITYFLLKEVENGIDPLGPENKLIFALGPLTGTSVIGNGRNGVGAKSPLTGGIALSQSGGYWGAELKRAGYDCLIVEEQSDTPVFLYINNDSVEIRDASKIWGSNTKETQEMIIDELGEQKLHFATIGPGGENMVPYACIMSGLHSAAGRGGMGAVMGSKKLKAIAVKGDLAPALADKDRVKSFNKDFVKDTLYKPWITSELKEYGTLGPGMEDYEVFGDLPVRNFRDGEFPAVKQISGIAIKEKIRTGMKGCFACPINCKKVVETGDPYFVDPSYGGPEYEALSALGSNCGVDNLEAISKANQLCNAYSLDVISAGGSISFAMECYERGLLDQNDTEGIDLRFGNADAVLECVEMLAQNRGFGAFLAQGSAKMAQQIGNGSEEYSMQVKGLEAGQHEPRLMPGMGLGFMINPHGADHCLNTHDTKFSISVDMYNEIGDYEKVPTGEMSPRKVRVFKAEHLRQEIFDCMLLCHFAASGMSYTQLAEIVSAVTGLDISKFELLRIAQRALTMARIYNIREGFTAKDDKLPKRFFTPKTNGALSETALNEEDMEKAKEYYYMLMGWNHAGVPTEATLEDLGIDFKI